MVFGTASVLLYKPWRRYVEKHRPQECGTDPVPVIDDEENGIQTFSSAVERQAGPLPSKLGTGSDIHGMSSYNIIHQQHLVAASES